MKTHNHTPFLVTQCYNRIILALINGIKFIKNKHSPKRFFFFRIKFSFRRHQFIISLFITATLAYGLSTHTVIRPFINTGGELIGRPYLYHPIFVHQSVREHEFVIRAIHKTVSKFRSIHSMTDFICPEHQLHKMHRTLFILPDYVSYLFDIVWHDEVGFQLVI